MERFKNPVELVAVNDENDYGMGSGECIVTFYFACDSSAHLSLLENGFPEPISIPILIESAQS